MANIKWMEKNGGRTKSAADVSVRIAKHGNGCAYITFRNGYRDRIAPNSDFLTFGMPRGNMDILIFKESDQSKGWKLYRRTGAEHISVMHIYDKEMIERLERFVGDYSIHKINDNAGATYYCINCGGIL